MKPVNSRILNKQNKFSRKRNCGVMRRQSSISGDCSCHKRVNYALGYPEEQFQVLEKQIFKKEECIPICVWDRIEFVREQCEGLLPDERCECYAWYGVDDNKIDRYYYNVQRIEQFTACIGKSEIYIYISMLLHELRFRYKVCQNRMEELVPAPDDLDWETVQYVCMLWKERLERYFRVWMTKI